MRLNRDLLIQRTREVRNSLEVLGRYRELPRERFLGSLETVDATKYRLLVAIEATISICTHLSARLAQKTPDSYAECFDILASENIIPVELAERLGRMARFRNLLVHLYWEVDDSRVWDILQSSLEDLETYLEEVGKIFKE